MNGGERKRGDDAAPFLLELMLHQVRPNSLPSRGFHKECIITTQRGKEYTGLLLRRPS